MKFKMPDGEIVELPDWRPDFMVFFGSRDVFDTPFALYRSRIEERAPVKSGGEFVIQHIRIFGLEGTSWVPVLRITVEVALFQRSNFAAADFCTLEGRALTRAELAPLDKPILVRDGESLGVWVQHHRDTSRPGPLKDVVVHLIGMRKAPSV